MRRHIHISITALLAGAGFVRGAYKPFSLQDDVLASPQFEVQFLDEYILESDARSRLAKAQSQSPTSTATSSQNSQTPDIVSQDDRSDLSQQVRRRGKSGTEDTGFDLKEDDIMIGSYHEMILDGQKFLCGIPNISPAEKDNKSTTPLPNPEQEAVELARATNRGLELLSDLEGKCLYYAAGWWSYSFCYMNEVRQFRALLPGKGVPVYPPAEDPHSTTFVLGRFQGNDEDDTASTTTSTEVAALQTKGESWYLVQYMKHGTICDLTKKPRKIEVQFHCHPQTPEHIAWIKEDTTCSYVMVVYTPRLCNDVAFQPPRVEKPNNIKCREVIIPEHVPIWEAAKAAKNVQAKRERVEGTEEPFAVVGDIEVGAMKLVGKDGKRIETDQFIFNKDEKIVLVAKREGGKVKLLSKETLRKHKVSSEKFELVKKELDIASEGRDWRIEEVTTSKGEGLRGIIDDGYDDEEEGDEADDDEVEGVKGTAKKGTKLRLQQQKTKTKKRKPQSEKRPLKAKPQGRQKESEDEQALEAGSDETYRTPKGDGQPNAAKGEKPVEAYKEEESAQDKKSGKDEL